MDRYMTTGRLWRVQFMGRYMISDLFDAPRIPYPVALHRSQLMLGCADPTSACVKVTETVYIETRAPCKQALMRDSGERTNK